MRRHPELNNADNEDHQEVSSILDKLRQSKAAKVAAVTLGAAALAGGILKINHDHQVAPRDKADQIAAVEIAKRFECTLESLEDTGQEPTARQLGQNERASGRTTVRMQVSLNEISAATPYIQKYADSSAVLWSPPVVSGVVNPGADVLTLPELAERGQPLAGEQYQEAHKEGQYPASLDIELYPKTDYPDGKQARIYVSTSVTTADSPEGDVYTQYAMNGSIDCGAMIFDGATRTWKQLPHPVKSETIVQTDTTIFEDKDGDSVWHPVQEGSN